MTVDQPRTIRWITDWIIQWIRHRYHRWWQLVALLVIVLAIKALVIMGSFLWRSGWLLTNQGQLSWIDDWIIKWRRNRYYRWWKLIALWMNVLAIKAPVIMRSPSLPTLIVPCSTFVETINTLWKWHDEWNMILWWRCVPVLLFVDIQKKLRASFFGATTAVMFKFQYQE